MSKTIIRLAGAAMLGLVTLAAFSLSPAARIVIGVIVGLPSLVLTIASRRQLGKSFSVMPEAKGLVTTGVYSKIQHPMYFFLDLFLLALLLALNSASLLWIWALLVILQVLQSRREEAVLRASFGAEYEAYIRQTWF